MSRANKADRGERPLRRRVLLGYSAGLSLSAGFVNAVAILILAFPVGNLTAVTTQIGMHAAQPWLYEGRLLLGIVLGFLVGAGIAGVILSPTQALVGRRQATVLVFEAALLALVAAGIEISMVEDEIAALGIEQAPVQAMLAAAALGMQNALTSNHRGMGIRTTHFTGTVTDLGLMVGRSRWHGIDKWKATVLSTTFLLFLAGGIAGLLVGSRLGGAALLVPAAACVGMAAASVLHGRVHAEVSDE